MKTKTSGIRFKEADIDFIKKREGLNTVQQVFSFLMNEYFKIYRVEKPSVFTPVNKESFNGEKNNHFKMDEIGQWEEPKKPLELRRRKPVEEYVLEKREILDPDDYQDWLKRVENDPFLTPKQIQLCKQST